MNKQKGSATVVLLVVLVVVLAAVLVYFTFLKKPGEVAVSPTPTATKTATPAPINEQNLDFKLNAGVEKEAGEIGFRTRVTYSVAVTGVLAKSSGDWTLQLSCPQGVVIDSVAGEQNCPTDQLRVPPSPTISFAFKNKTSSIQSVTATARLLSGKDNQTPIATSTNITKIPVY
jgi:hypothetical protein